ncbi:MAG: glycosyltransferase family 2 protein [Alphaproteobacteria bacterium]|nr:glycosyltransferase family 2 protein [Alphaproteobacteria bacterium]
MTATLGIIVPVYREAAGIESFHRRLLAAIEPLRPRYVCEVLYVVDPAPDDTEAILARLVAERSGLSALVMSRRFGHQAALLAGLDHSRHDAVIMLDGDLQHPPELIADMLARFEAGADIVQCVRRDAPGETLFKRVTSRWFYRLMDLIAGIALRPGSADFRLMSRRVADLFRDRLRERSLFLRGLVSWVGFTTAVIHYDPPPRATGASHFTLTRLLRFALSGVLSHSRTPLRVAFPIGAAMLAFGIGTGVWQALACLDVVVSPSSAWNVAGIVSGLGGIQMLFIGILGEYVGMVLDEVKGRPHYLIDRTHRSRPDRS